MYFKKRKMYDLVVELLSSCDLFQLVGDSPVPAMRDCSYKFYRGSEWLNVSFEDVYVVLYHGNCYISIEVFDFDSDKSLYRKCFCNNEYIELISKE